MSATVDKWGCQRDERWPNAVFGAQHPTRYEHITQRDVSVNGRAMWGSMLECSKCGAENVQLTGSSVSYEDGPMHFSRHECQS